MQRPPPTAARGPSPQEINAVLALCQRGQWREAEAAAAGLLKRHPRDVALLNLHGSACSQQNDLARAAESFRAAASLAPASPELAFNLGVTLGRLGRLDEAIAAYGRAVALKPEFAVAHYNLGTALKEHGRHEAAVASLQRAVALQPRDVASHANLGAALQALGRLDEALASYRAAQAIAPSAKGHLSLAAALRAQGHLGDAAAELQRAIALDAGYADAHNNLGETRWDQGDADAALAAWRAALAVDPAHAEAHYNLGVLFLAGGRPDEALPHFEQSRLRDWQARQLYCLYKTRRFDAFRAALAALAAAGPHHAPLVATLSAHHAANFGGADAYGYCRDPLACVHHARIAELAEPGSALVAELLRDVTHADLAERKQGRLVRGIQSAGHLFKRPEASFRELARLIEREVVAYRAALVGRDAEFARAFPATPSFSSAWYVKMRQGGHLTSHIHETGWASGVVYLAMPPRAAGSDDGCIEFSIDGDDYPRERDDYPRRIVAPQVGDVLLFPSSLFHRTIPFAADQDRVCVAFDIAP